MSGTPTFSEGGRAELTPKEKNKATKARGGNNTTTYRSFARRRLNSVRVEGRQAIYVRERHVTRTLLRKKRRNDGNQMSSNAEPTRNVQGHSPRQNNVEHTRTGTRTTQRRNRLVSLKGHLAKALHEQQAASPRPELRNSRTRLISRSET